MTHDFKTHGTMSPYGTMVHTTGIALPSRAYHRGVDLADETIRVYSNMGDIGPHLVILPSGNVLRLRPTDRVAWHCGLSDWERQQYLSGKWATDNRIDRSVVAHWESRWSPRYRSPSHLYPSKRPNTDYVGIELVPAVVDSKTRRGTEWMFGTAASAESWFSAQQYFALAKECVTLAEQYGWPVGWQHTGRLVGHEDVNPYTRPGWDPGIMSGKFHWGLLTGGIDVEVLSKIQSSVVEQ